MSQRPFHSEPPSPVGDATGIPSDPEDQCAPTVSRTNVPRPVIDDIKLFGTVDRTLSEMKYILDHPDEFDAATWQTFKHHVEDMGLFFKHATGKMEKMGKIASLPPAYSTQRQRGY